MRTRPRFGLLFLTALALSACIPDTRQAVLKSALAGVNIIRGGFATWDVAHQQQIVTKATSAEDGKAQLAGYRQAREKVTLAFEIAYKLLAMAAFDLTEANIGTALHAVGDIYDLVRKLTGGAVAGGP